MNKEDLGITVHPDYGYGYGFDVPFEIKETQDSIIVNSSQKMFTKIVDMQEKETLKAIEKYCEENNIIPNLIDKEKLDLVLKLGIQELNLKELKGGNNE